MDAIASGSGPATVRTTRSDSGAWPLLSLVYAAASAFVLAILVRGTTSMPAGATALLVTAIPTLLAPLFAPVDRSPGRGLAAGVLAWALSVALLAALARLVVDAAVDPTRLLPAALVALGIVGVAHLARCLLEVVLDGIASDAAAARCMATWTVTALLWVTSAAPLWLGPAADLAARVEPATPTRILACSPLAHLAAAAGYDVLRSEWLYAHTSLGALQVAYPRIAALFAGYGLATAALGSVLVFLRRTAHVRAGNPSSLPSLEHYT